MNSSSSTKEKFIRSDKVAKNHCSDDTVCGHPGAVMPASQGSVSMLDPLNHKIP